jgi:type IV secretion system protein VirB1
MPLTIAQVLAVAAACAPSVAPTTLLAVARAESGLDPLAIGVMPPARPLSQSRTVHEAVRRAEHLIATGRDIDIGLAQINVSNLSRLGLSLADAFDPCRNLAASAQILADGYQRALPSYGPGQSALRIALSFYNTGTPDRGFRNGYVARVLTKAGAAALERPDSAAPNSPAPVASWDVFGRARLVPTDFVVRPTLGAQP